MNTKVEIQIEIEGDQPHRLVVEPWGGTYILRPLTEYSVCLEGDDRLPLSLRIGQSHTVLSCFDSAGASLMVLRNGVEMSVDE